MFFDDWRGLGRIVAAAICCYPALILSLRISGKRTLAKLNAFDFVVTVALGSTLASVITSRGTPIAEGLLALGCLILLQYVVASLSRRSQRFRQAIKSEPRLLYGEEGPLWDAMREERVDLDDIRSAARAVGAPNLEQVRFVVLETNGELTVILRTMSGVLDGVAQA